VHNAGKCLENRQQEASDELLDIRELLDIQVETGADCGAEPDVQQAAQEEDEAAAEAVVFEEWEAQGAEEPDPDMFTAPGDVSYNAMDDY
jgi:hypothetical protein